jgi:hypothetical protein
MEQGSLGKKRGIADIVLLIDITGSMQSCLDALRTNIEVMINGMVNPGPNADAVVKDWRIKVVGFRDVRADGDHWWEESPFETDVSAVRGHLAKLQAAGGDDEPESLLDALWKLATQPATGKGEQTDSLKWRHRSDAARVVIAFTDASCHMTTSLPEAGGAGFEDVAREIMAAKLRISLFCPEADCYTASFSMIDAIEIETIGSLSDAKEKMKEFTGNPEHFKNTLRALAKSISASSVTPTL